MRKFQIVEAKTLPEFEDCNVQDHFDDLLSPVSLQSLLHPLSKPVCMKALQISIIPNSFCLNSVKSALNMLA